MTTGAEPVAAGVDAQLIVDAILNLGVTHIIVVPDTFQRTLIAKLTERDSPKLVRVFTEDEAMGVNAGLYMGGQRPMMLL